MQISRHHLDIGATRIAWNVNGVTIFTASKAMYAFCWRGMAYAYLNHGCTRGFSWSLKDGRKVVRAGQPGCWVRVL
jgi:hypothetical protein